jgi:hypothetical protein
MRRRAEPSRLPGRSPDASGFLSLATYVPSSTSPTCPSATWRRGRTCDSPGAVVDRRRARRGRKNRASPLGPRSCPSAVTAPDSTLPKPLKGSAEGQPEHSSTHDRPQGLGSDAKASTRPCKSSTKLYKPDVYAPTPGERAATPRGSCSLRAAAALTRRTSAASVLPRPLARAEGMAPAGLTGAMPESVRQARSR